MERHRQPWSPPFKLLAPDEEGCIVQVYRSASSDPNGIDPSQSVEAVSQRQVGVLDTPAFLRLFQLRGEQIMWFLGAGASRSAGIKTAGDMIWDFKQRLYRSQKKLPPSAITDIGEPAVRRKLQAHFDGLVVCA
jgi:hypothetical protein